MSVSVCVRAGGAAGQAGHGQGPSPVWRAESTMMSGAPACALAVPSSAPWPSVGSVFLCACSYAISLSLGSLVSGLSLYLL